MGIIKLGDMSAVGAVPPDGAYAVTITKVDAKASANKEKPSTNIFLDLMIEGVVGDNSDEETAKKFVGQTISTLVNVQASTLWRVQEVLEAVTGREWREDDMEFDPDDLLGGGAIVEGTIGDYKGKPQFQISNWYAQDSYSS